MKIVGTIVNDGTGFLPWGFSIKVDGRVVVERQGFFSYQFLAKRALRKAVNNYTIEPYSYEIEKD